MNYQLTEGKTMTEEQLKNIADTVRAEYNKGNEGMKAEKTKYVIINIERGKNNFQRNFLYAELINMDTGHLAISATLDYILKMCLERKYKIINFDVFLKIFLDFYLALINERE